MTFCSSQGTVLSQPFIDVQEAHSEGPQRASGLGGFSGLGGGRVVVVHHMVVIGILKSAAGFGMIIAVLAPGPLDLA